MNQTITSRAGFAALSLAVFAYGALATPAVAQSTTADQPNASTRQPPPL